MKASVLITGGSGGSGLFMARHFAARGMNVFLTSREEKDADSAAEAVSRDFPDIICKGYQSSVGNEDHVIAMFEDIRALGCLVTSAVLNAADLGIGMDVLTVQLADFMRVIETNLGWNFSIARQAALHMIDAGGGSIVFVGSNTYQRAIKGRVAYVASKGGIVSLAKALAVELGQYKIRVNTLVPGSIKTVRWEAISEEAQNAKKSRLPIGDIADFEDMANAAYFLANNLSKNVTGTELLLDGGAGAQLFPGT